MTYNHFFNTLSQLFGQREVIEAFSGLSWMYTQTCTLAALWVPSDALQIFKACYEYLIPPTCLFSFWFTSCLPQLILLPHAATVSHHCFQQVPWG